MTWETSWGDPLADYLGHYAGLIGDRRTGVTFGAVVRGISRGRESGVRADCGAFADLGHDE